MNKVEKKISKIIQCEINAVDGWSVTRDGEIAVGQKSAKRILQYLRNRTKRIRTNEKKKTRPGWAYISRHEEVIIS